MFARGRVKDGVIVLENGLHLPEEQEVAVFAAGGTTVTSGTNSSQSHGILDIQPVSVGAVLRPLTPEDDLLGDTLEGRA